MQSVFHLLFPSLQAFGPITKVYATGGEPCCAECVTPVFNEAWSSRTSFKPRLSTKLARCSEEREGEGREEEREGEGEGEGEELASATASLPASSTCSVSFIERYYFELNDFVRRVLRDLLS